MKQPGLRLRLLGASLIRWVSAVQPTVSFRVALTHSTGVRLDRRRVERWLIANEAVISAIFFILSSSADLPIYNAGTERMFLNLALERLRRRATRFLVEARQQ